LYNVFLKAQQQGSDPIQSRPTSVDSRIKSATQSPSGTSGKILNPLLVEY